MTQEDDQNRTGAENVPEDIGRLGGLITQVVGPTTLIVALIVYLSALQTKVFLGEFGIDQRLLQLSVQDYLLYAAGSSLEFMVGLLLFVLFLAFAYVTATRFFARRPSTARWVSRVLTVLGMVGLAAGLSSMWFGTILLYAISAGNPFLYYAVPIGLGGGLLLLAYSAVLRRISGIAVARQIPAPLRRAVRVIFWAVIALLILWAAGHIAQIRGIDQAYARADNPVLTPEVSVYSPRRLHLAGPGVVETELPGGRDAHVRYHYEGLRLLTYSHGLYVLLPVCWAEHPGTRTITLRDDGFLRLEFSKVRDAPRCPAR